MAKLTEEQLEWVYKQDWFPKYCVNLIKLGDPKEWDSLINDNTTELISYAFTWSATSEGRIYWETVDEEWKNYLKKSSELVLTIDEIAKKFNTDPENIRIVK